MMRGRLLLVTALVGLWMAGTALRLYDLQVLEYDKYSERAEQQQQGVVILDPPRGTIYDARGRQLAVSVEVRSLAANPREIDDPKATAKAIYEALRQDVPGLQRSKIVERLSSDRQFVWIRRKLDLPLVERVEALELEGVFTLPESKRYYPMRRLAAQVLGYVGTDNQGLAGLEYRYEDKVGSAKGKRTVVRDARRGIMLPLGTDIDAAKPGMDLHLTLDATIQHIVERELDRAMRTSSSKRGMVVLMDPQDGAILAMASSPTFDPNTFNAFKAETWRNQPLTDAFEPGSTFKMVTLAAALEEGGFDPLAKIDCGMGKIFLNRVRINDHKPFGMLTTREVMAQSSNVGAIKLGRHAGTDRFYETIRAFGFGEPTEIDLPSESAGILHPRQTWSPLAPAYISFGQGISITAIQLTRAFAAIANGGFLLRPYLVRGIGHPDRDPVNGDPADGGIEPWRGRKVVGTPVSPATIDQIRDILTTVVTDGTADAAAVPGYRVAGKTGTAEKVVKGRGYAANKYVASFVGFTPVSRPALVGAVILDEPWPLYHGGEVAAPVFSAIAQQVLLYLGVTPERDLPPPVERPQIQLAETLVAQDDTSEPTAEPLPEGTIPDLRGLSARQALHRGTLAGLTLALNGHGAVERQLPAPGTPKEEAGGTVELWLRGGATP